MALLQRSAMMGTSQVRRSSGVSGACSRPKALRVMAAKFEDAAPKQKGSLNPEGFITDNSAKGNIFPTSSKPFIDSPTSAAAAASGPLGGASGVVILSAVAAAIIVVAFGALESPEMQGTSLEAVSAAFTGDSLTAIADRLASSL